MSGKIRARNTAGGEVAEFGAYCGALWVFGPALHRLLGTLDGTSDYMTLGVVLAVACLASAVAFGRVRDATRRAWQAGTGVLAVLGVAGGVLQAGASGASGHAVDLVTFATLGAGTFVLVGTNARELAGAGGVARARGFLDLPLVMALSIVPAGVPWLPGAEVGAGIVTGTILGVSIALGGDDGSRDLHREAPLDQKVARKPGAAGAWTFLLAIGVALFVAGVSYALHDPDAVLGGLLASYAGLFTSEATVVEVATGALVGGTGLGVAGLRAADGQLAMEPHPGNRRALRFTGLVLASVIGAGLAILLSRALALAWVATGLLLASLACLLELVVGGLSLHIFKPPR